MKGAYARRLRTSQGILPLTWVPLLMKKETQECVSSFLHHYVCIKRIPTAALSASGCGSKRSASSQPANSPAPHILSNSLTTSIPLSDRNINIFFCDVTPYVCNSLLICIFSKVIIVRNDILVMSIRHSEASRDNAQRSKTNPFIQMECMYI